MSKHKSRSQALNHRDPSSLYAAKKGSTGAPRNAKDAMAVVKSTARDIIPTGAEMKGYLPTILSVGAVALGAVGIYALWKNRDKVEAFMGEHDIELPSFLKGGAKAIAKNVEEVATH